MLERNN